MLGSWFWLKLARERRDPLETAYEAHAPHLCAPIGPAKRSDVRTAPLRSTSMPGAQALPFGRSYQ